MSSADYSLTNLYTFDITVPHTTHGEHFLVSFITLPGSHWV